MEDYTIWHIGSLMLPLDMGDADAQERLENGMRILTEHAPKMQQCESLAAFTRQSCKAYREMYDAIFGEGVSESIFAEIPDNLRKYAKVFHEFQTFLQNQQKQARAETEKYLPQNGKKKAKR